ncbi:MAG: EAL domain-containing protein [Lachnospiraceae bacterium]|nr:EAL domain-containing protein [Lachnospiraceae bacterium]
MTEYLFNNDEKKALIRDNERYEEVNEITGTYVFEYDAMEDKYYVCATYENMFWLDDDMKKGPWTMVESLRIDPRDQEDYSKFIEEIKNGASKRNETFRIINKADKNPRWFSVTIQTLKGLNNALVRVIGILQDVNTEMEARMELAYRRTYDTLTQLLNADSFYAQTEAMIKANPMGRYIMLAIGIENFSIVIDRFGSEMGNDVLKFFAGCLRERLSMGNAACRYDTNTFMVSLTNFSDADVLILIRDLNVVFERDSISKCGAGLTYGIYKVEDTTMDVQRMCERAQLARDEVVSTRMTNYAFYNENIMLSIKYRAEMESEMNPALERHEFVMYLQPKIDVLTGKICSAEALVRWQHTPTVLRMPGEFLPLFEQNGFIKKLDEYMWETAAEYISELKKEGLEIPISVNISRFHVDNTDLVKTITGFVEKYGIESKLLQLEITETLFAKDEQKLYYIMGELKNKGFVLEMDDFGSGYSSLNMLRAAPVDVIKIDKYFIDDIMLTSKGSIVIENTVRMLKELGMVVVAEGVERKEQLDFLKDVGCDIVQGYYFSKPVPADDFTEMLRKDQRGEGV